jgi:hypothetical protein
MLLERQFVAARDHVLGRHRSEVLRLEILQCPSAERRRCAEHSLASGDYWHWCPAKWLLSTVASKGGACLFCGTRVLL